MSKIIVNCLAGLFLIFAGIWMSKQYNTLTKEVVINGTKERNAVIGGGAGAATGIGIGAAIGAVGIAACGTGIGIPVGAVCLGLGALLGGAGAVTGYVSGS